MPDHLRTTLAASDHGDNPTCHVDRLAQVINRMEDLGAKIRLSPGWNVWRQACPQHEVRRVENSAVEPNRKFVGLKGNLAHLGAEFDVGQATGYPSQVLIEFFSTDTVLRAVEKVVKPLLGVKESHERVRTCGVNQRDEVFQVRDLDGGFRK